MTHPADIERHPDIAEMRTRYEIAAASPVAQLMDGLTLLSGIYLALSPWIVGFNGLAGITLNNLVTGLCVAGLGLGFSFAFGRTYGIAWCAPVLGVWTIVAPWVISGDMSTTRTIWSNVIVGALICVLGLATMSLAGSRAGWRMAPRMGQRSESRR
ncbi:SPW repeat protein [Actinomadura sp. 6N118]|uniref:SPW repeat protein n=1 Tax=Actinomadura sp. 6N118 TaxID=3375151 RepID=UPI00378FAB31